MSLGSVVVVLLAVALFVAAVALLRSGGPNPWSSIVLAMATTGVCFTVGGASGDDSSGPSVATVTAAVVGLTSVASAITALVPRSPDSPPSRVPRGLATAGIVIGAVGLVVNQLTS